MKLEKRQTVILGLVIVAIIILIWQLYALFGDKTSAGPLEISQERAATSTLSSKINANPTQVMQTPTGLAGQVSGEPSAQMTESQRKYMALVNEYQIVEMQRLIAQDEAAIAAARAAAAESLSKINQTGSNMNGISGTFSNIDEDTGSGDYELIYTGQDNGEWTATLKKGGQFNDVTAGSALPGGDKVLSVDENGVLIQEEDSKKLITFNGAVPANENDKTSTMPQSPPEKLQSQFQVQKKSTPAAETSASSPTKPKPSVLPKVVAAHVPALDIMQADKTAYTLQIVSDNNLKAVNQFMSDNQLTNKAQVIKVLRDKKPWYIGVIGEYPTAADAQKAIQSLPEAVREEEPFPRSIADVQADRVK